MSENRTGQDPSTLDGDELVRRTEQALAAEPLDPELVRALCAEIDNRIMRGDLMIGILPMAAERVLARGLAAAGAAGDTDA